MWMGIFFSVLVLHCGSQPSVQVQYGPVLATKLRASEEAREAQWRFGKMILDH